ncbi:hypothetical protein [Streptomyces sp. NBC_00344]|uniref:hypothetical protein n=1 Tax=Streptomyces sp. NBC_00344 TaxID=2975720 RepID=UPI002E20D337
MLLDGVPVTTSRSLDIPQATHVARAVAGHLEESTRGADGRTVHPVAPGFVAEIRRTSGRHATVQFVRLRPLDT